MAEILKLPVRPRLHLVESASERQHAGSDDLDAAAKHIRAALVSLEVAVTFGNQVAIERMVEDIEAAAFYGLTHLGCRELDRPLRNMLASRHAEREARRG